MDKLDPAGLVAQLNAVLQRLDEIAAQVDESEEYFEQVHDGLPTGDLERVVAQLDDAQRLVVLAIGALAARKTK
jgi:DNA-binding MurR/RpiR family transcriptional regulator